MPKIPHGFGPDFDLSGLGFAVCFFPFQQPLREVPLLHKGYLNRMAVPQLHRIVCIDIFGAVVDQKICSSPRGILPYRRQLLSL